MLLAIAREIDGKGTAEMTMAAIAGNARLSERAARDAVRELERLGELAVEARPGAAARYALRLLDPGRICRPTPADIAAPAESAALPTPAESAAPVDNPPKKPQVGATPAESAAPEISNDLELGSVVSGGKSKSKSSSEPPRDDVTRLCQHLADRIEANGSRRPAIGKKWHDAARLLIDNDGRTEQNIRDAIDWCQGNSFWKSHIMSMPKLREKYDTLRLQALEEQKRKSQHRNGRQPTPDEFAALRDSWARPLDAMEAGNDTRGNDRPHGVHRRSLPPAAN